MPSNNPAMAAMLGGGGTPNDAVPMPGNAPYQSHGNPGKRRKHKLSGKKRAGHRVKKGR